MGESQRPVGAVENKEGKRKIVDHPVGIEHLDGRRFARTADTVLGFDFLRRLGHWLTFVFGRPAL